MINFDINCLAWEKMNGLLPAIIQNAETLEVLMLGYMNQEALKQTLASRQLHFYSRSKKRLWCKGESSGNRMIVQSIRSDCDHDCLFVLVIPAGATCHLGNRTCFKPDPPLGFDFLNYLMALIKEREQFGSEQSYVKKLLHSNKAACAQKLGEEAVEVVIAVLNQGKIDVINEAADLFFHLLILLEHCQLSFFEIIDCLKERHLNHSN